MDVNAVDADIQFITELCLLLLYIFHTALETYLSTDLLLVNSAGAAHTELLVNSMSEFWRSCYVMFAISSDKPIFVLEYQEMSH